jgi:predicted permease
MLATMLGAIAAAIRFEPPVALDRLLSFLQSAAAPAALFTLGVTVALRPLQKMPWEVPIAVAIKLIVHPVLALVLMSLLGPFTAVWVQAAVLMASLPQALNVFVLARQYDSWVAQASSAVLLGTLVSVVTLTTVMWLVRTNQLPLTLFP